MVQGCAHQTPPDHHPAPLQSTLWHHPEQFADLCRKLEPISAAQRFLRLDPRRRPQPRVRQRHAPGAGVKPMPFATRLLIALTRLRLGIPQRATP
jgi:hypothetical protein